MVMQGFIGILVPVNQKSTDGDLHEIAKLDCVWDDRPAVSHYKSKRRRAQNHGDGIDLVLCCDKLPEMSPELA